MKISLQTLRLLSETDSQAKETLLHWEENRTFYFNKVVEFHLDNYGISMTEATNLTNVKRKKSKTLIGI